MSFDDLLSEKEMEKVVERTPVIEKKSANIIMIALYAFAAISFLVTVFDIVIRFLLPSQSIDSVGIGVIILYILGLTIPIVFFIYGFIQAIRGVLSPKRMGAVISAYFGSMCLMLSGSVSVFVAWQILVGNILWCIPNLFGAVASFFYFVRGNNSKIFLYMIYIASAWGMFRLILSNYQLIVFTRQNLSMNTMIGVVVKVAMYGLIIYQTYTLWKKRKNAMETNVLQ